MLEALKQSVYEANMLLPKFGLVTFTWGNASGIDRDKGVFAIKPSGVPYETLAPDDIVLIDVQTGEKVEGRLNPSSDTPTHAELYRRFPSIGGVVHTHSRWATIFAQAGRDIPAYGTTHADYIYGSVPCAPYLTQEQVESAYELETGRALADMFERRKLDPAFVPCALASAHGPFAWGKDALEAAHNAAVLEEVAMMAYHTELLSAGQPRLPMRQYVMDKHFLRKHGANAYYGQK